MTRFDDIRLLRINYLRGPNIWTYRPVLEVWLDLGALEDHPSNTIARLHRAPDRAAAGADRAPLRRRRARRLHPAPERRHLGRPRAGARGDRAAEPGRHADRLRPDPQHLAARRLSHGVPRPRRAGRAGRAGRGPPAADGRDQRRPLRRRRRAARGRRGQGQGRGLLPGPEHRLHRRRRHRPRHSAPAPEQRQPGAAGLRRQPAPHLDRRDRLHQRHRRIDRQRQGADQVAARRAAACRCPRARWSPTPRKPGKRPRTSACRWWSSPPTPTTAAACRSNCARARTCVAAFAVAEPEGSERDGRALHPRPRAPPAGGRRPGGRGRRAARSSR